MIQPKEKMEKHVAVRGDFTDTLYIEQAGLQSTAMAQARSVWCHTTVYRRRATLVGSTAKMASTGTTTSRSLFSPYR